MKDGTGADLSPRKLKASAVSLDDRATDRQSYAHSFGLGGKGWPEHAKRITSRIFCSFVSSVLSWTAGDPVPSLRAFAVTSNVAALGYHDSVGRAPLYRADCGSGYSRVFGRILVSLQQSLAVCPQVRP